MYFIVPNLVVNLNNQEIYPFPSFGSILGFLNGSNPARCKAQNLLELESGRNDKLHSWVEQHEIYSYFGISHLWADICKIVHRTVKDFPYEQREAWKLCNIGDRTHMMAPEDAAAELGRNIKTVRRWLRNINGDLERQFIARGFMPKIDA